MTHLTRHNAHTPSFPVDQTTIRTSVRLKNVLFDCPAEKVDQLPDGLANIVRSISHGAKRPPAYLRTDKQSNIPSIPTRKIVIDGYGTATLFASKLPGSTFELYEVRYNPGKLINGHNGHVLTEEDFLRALSVLRAVITPLLHDENDWIHIVPGLDSKGRAYWHNLEIPFHIIDEDGRIISSFGNGKHEKINVPPSYRYHGQSILFVNSTGDLHIRAYRKDIQMRKAERGTASADGVLRIEVKLEGEKLREYLDRGTWKVMEGEPRLVSFSSADLRSAHAKVMSGFTGVYTSGIPAVDVACKDKMGDYMGWVSTQTDLTVDKQVAFGICRYSSGLASGSMRNKKSRLRIAARKFLEQVSTIKFNTLFSDDAWNLQPGVSVPRVERITRSRHDGIEIHPDVQAVYGSTNQGSLPNPLLCYQN
jgi:hypothetical protein